MSDTPIADIHDGEWHLRPIAVNDNDAHQCIMSGFVVEGPVKTPLFLRVDDGKGAVTTVTLTWYSLLAVLRVLTHLLDYAEFKEKT